MKKLFVAALALILIPPLQAEDWKTKLKEALPLMGHRNWIVVTDSAYPWQVSPGVQTIQTGASQQEVLREVLEEMSATKHVKPFVYTDREMDFVPEDAAPGITAYRQQIAKLLATTEISKLPHENIISMLDEAGKTFHILLLKTNMTIPYTSVFLRLDCGYWDANSEKRLRSLLPAK